MSAVGSHIRLGATLSQRFRLGLDLFGMAASKGQFGDLSGSGDDSKENVGDATVSLWFYPSATGNFWLQGGVGGVAYISNVKNDQKYTAVGGGGVLGVGYDFRVGRNGSLTPYVRWAATNNAKLKDADGNEVPGPGTWKNSYFAFGLDYVFH